MALPATVLTTLATVKGELNIADGSKDAVLERLIQVATDAIEKYCQRKFSKATPSESLRPSGTLRLMLSRTPVLAITSVTVDGTLLAAPEYSIEDADAGFLFRLSGWPTAELMAMGASREPVTGTSQATIVVVYSGGFVTPQSVVLDVAAVRTLPFDLEQAAIEVVSSLYLNRGQDRTVLTEKINEASITYRDSVDTAGLLPAAVLPLLVLYRRLA